jgi:hypothetical protein
MYADLRAAHTANDLAATARVYLSPTTNLWRICLKNINAWLQKNKPNDKPVPRP